MLVRKFFHKFCLILRKLVVLGIVKEYIEDFINLIFPDTCLVCGALLHRGENLLCLKCLYQLPRTDYCKFPQENQIIDLFAGRLRLEKATALFYFQKASAYRHLLHLLKYKNKPQIGIMLGKELGALMLDSKNFNDIDIIVPVPLHKKREKERGYNQSYMIAQGISKILKKPAFDNLFIRNEYTVTQTKMSKEERWKNVSGKFSITDIGQLTDKHVLLVDDVVTTGSTIEACGEELLKVPGLKLSLAVLAKA